MAFWAIIISYFDSDLSVPRTHTHRVLFSLCTHQSRTAHTSTPQHSPAHTRVEQHTPALTRAEQQRGEYTSTRQHPPEQSSREERVAAEGHRRQQGGGAARGRSRLDRVSEHGNSAGQEKGLGTPRALSPHPYFSLIPPVIFYITSPIGSHPYIFLGSPFSLL
jgi:hypothetical protein